MNLYFRYMQERGSSLCHPTEEIQCIDVILRQGALESYVKVCNTILILNKLNNADACNYMCNIFKKYC